MKKAVEERTTMIQEAEIVVKDINTGKDCRINFASLKEGRSTWLEKKYGICCTYPAKDSRGEHFSVELGWQFHQFSKETQTFLADTEIAHIARGHIKCGRFHSSYSKYLAGDKYMNMATDLYVAYKGHQQLTKDLINKIFDEIEVVPMSNKDKKMLEFRREHLLKIIDKITIKKEKEKDGLCNAANIFERVRN